MLKAFTLSVCLLQSMKLDKTDGFPHKDVAVGVMALIHIVLWLTILVRRLTGADWVNSLKTSSIVASVEGDTETHQVCEPSCLPNDSASPTKNDFNPVLKATNAASTARGIKLDIEREQLTAAAVKAPPQLLNKYVLVVDGYFLGVWPPK